MHANVDLFNANGAQGDLANFVVQNKLSDPSKMKPFIGNDGRTYITVYSGSGDRFDMKNYRDVPLNTNATLRRDEWKQLDEAVLGVAKQRLGGVQDLIENNLTYNLGNAMGTTVLEHHRSKTDMTPQIDMDGLTRGPNARPEFDHKYLPIPIVHVDYELNLRELEASRKLGNPISTDDAEEAAFEVNKMLEQMLFTDMTYNFGGGTINSYVNFDDRITGDLSASWDDSSTTKEKIKNDVKKMKQDSIANYHYGPWVMYIPTAYETLMDDDYDVSGASIKTLRQRILEFGGIDAIKVSDFLQNDNVLLVEMSSRNVRLVRGMGMQNVQWSEQGGFVSKYKVMTIQVPQLRSDKNGRCGIVHYSV